MTKTFRDLGVDGALCDALAAEGITHPFPIQELTLPLALSGNDLIGQARTGTGKTLAFGLPLLQRLDPDRAVTQALVVVPTRELCLQVYDDLKIGAAKGLTSIAVYGGVGFDEQIDALRGGAHVVVGTPGRLLDHLNRRNLDLSHVTQLVLDEADEMLDMGFLPDVERLVEACATQGRHTMLFSATMPTAIVKLARRYMDHPTFTRADTEAHETAPNVTQHFLQVHRMDKPRVLARILQSPGRGGVYVFVRTKHMADRLVNELEELGVGAIPIHGDLRQSSREKNLDRFRSGKATVLVATEVAARGLDVSGVTHVVNYDCPDDEKMYLHRIGRTARAGEAGVAVTFAEFNEVDKLNVIRKRVGAVDTPVEQVFSTSDVLTQRFDLPEERPWDHLARTKGGERKEGDRAQAEPRRARDERPSGQRRRGSSDGRPKSERRTEGAGGGHDAKRDRDAASDRGGRARDQATPRARGSARGQDDASDRARTRTRTRSRGEATASSARQPDASTPPDGDGGSSPRKRARASRASTADTTAERAADAPSTGDAAPATRKRSTKKRASKTTGTRSADDRKGRTDQARGSDQAGGTDQAKGTAKGAQGDRARSSGRRTSTRDGARSGRQSGSTKRQTVSVEHRGRAARGEGQPQPSRRVKVEHLP